MKPTKLQLILERETKNCLVFAEVPASGQPVLRSPVYLPKPEGPEYPVALNLTIEVAAMETRPSVEPAPEAPVPKKARCKRASKAGTVTA